MTLPVSFGIRVLAVAMLAFISACKSIPVDEATARTVEKRQAELLQFDQWQALGRIALNSAEQGITGGVEWTQFGKDYKVSLTSPLGQALVVEQIGQIARLQSKGQPPSTGQNAERLIEKALQVRVPMRQLSLWLRGLPGNQGDPAYDKFGRLKQLRYTDIDGIAWRADIKRYQQVDQLDLPGLIVVEGGGYTIRVSVTEWNSTDTPDVLPAVPDTAPEPGGKRIAIPGLSS